MYYAVIILGIIALTAIILLAISRYIKSKSIWSMYDCTLHGIWIGSLIVGVMTGSIWGITYVERWDDQREVEAFIESNIDIEYARLIEGTIDINGSQEIVDLTPVSKNLNMWFQNVKRANEIIKKHTADNKHFLFDRHTPDWDAPKLITFAP